MAGKKVRRPQTLPVWAFIHGVVGHIPPKQFKMGRYFGLYAWRKAEAVQEILSKIGQMVGRTIRRLSWLKPLLRLIQTVPYGFLR